MSWIEPERNGVKRFRARVLMPRQIKIAQRKIRFGVLRDVRVRQREFLFCLNEIVRFERLSPGVVSVEGPKCGIALGPSDEDCRCKQEGDVNASGGESLRGDVFPECPASESGEEEHSR